MLGFITSPRAARVYEFLARVGPTPFAALAVGTRLRAGDLAKALRHLRGAGRAAPVRLRGVEFWAVDGSGFDLETQEALAWFAARAEEAGGRYERGNVSFPAGAYRVAAAGDQVRFGDFYCLLEDLRQRPLKECLRTRKISHEIS